MLTISLICNLGMSTSMLVKKMTEYAGTKGIEADIDAMPFDRLGERIHRTDILLIGPQVRHLFKKLQAEYGDKIPVIQVMNMYYYYLYDCRKALAIFYTVVILIYSVFGLMDSTSVNGGTVSGMESATIIFIFILGLNSFKSNFLFGLANGVSRKTQILSFAVTAVTLGAFMALADLAIGRFFSLFFENQALYFDIYRSRFAGASARLSLQILPESFLWSALLYSTAAMIGFTITLLYYRCSKLMKYVISIVPGMVLFILVPYLDRLYGGRLSSFILTTFLRLMDAAKIDITTNPYIAMISFVCTFGIFYIFSWLMIRRAVIKQ